MLLLPRIGCTIVPRLISSTTISRVPRLAILIDQYVSYIKFIMDFDVLLGLVLLGDSGIGKSQISVRYTEDAFSSTLKSTKGKSAHL